ncbi:hypothetical protein F1880_002634 [Penicillium rolfsii]|nr:hypothetical protein F1880_002634 [Penicillium rolfsii]
MVNVASLPEVETGTAIGGGCDLSDRTLQLVEASNGWPRVGPPNVNKAPAESEPEGAKQGRTQSY